MWVSYTGVVIRTHRFCSVGGVTKAVGKKKMMIITSHVETDKHIGWSMSDSGDTTQGPKTVEQLLEQVAALEKQLAKRDEEIASLRQQRSENTHVTVEFRRVDGETCSLRVPRTLTLLGLKKMYEKQIGIPHHECTLWKGDGSGEYDQGASTLEELGIQEGTEFTCIRQAAPRLPVMFIAYELDMNMQESTWGAMLPVLCSDQSEVVRHVVAMENTHVESLKVYANCTSILTGLPDDVQTIVGEYYELTSEVVVIAIVARPERDEEDEYADFYDSHGLDDDFTMYTTSITFLTVILP